MPLAMCTPGECNLERLKHHRRFYVYWQVAAISLASDGPTLGRPLRKRKSTHTQTAAEKEETGRTGG